MPFAGFPLLGVPVVLMMVNHIFSSFIHRSKRSLSVNSARKRRQSNFGMKQDRKATRPDMLAGLGYTRVFFVSIFLLHCLWFLSFVLLVGCASHLGLVLSVTNTFRSQIQDEASVRRRRRLGRPTGSGAAAPQDGLNHVWGFVCFGFVSLVSFHEFSPISCRVSYDCTVISQCGGECLS